MNSREYYKGIYDCLCVCEMLKKYATKFIVSLVGGLTKHFGGTKK